MIERAERNQIARNAIAITIAAAVAVAKITNRSESNIPAHTYFLFLCSQELSLRLGEGSFRGANR